MTKPICDSCETVAHCLTHGCIPLQKDASNYRLDPPVAEPLNAPTTMPTKTLHQHIYNYVQAHKHQRANEDLVTTALQTLCPDNQVFSLCEPLESAYNKLVLELAGQELMEWVYWWQYETEYGTRNMEFILEGVSYDPTTMTFYRFLELVDQ